MHVEEIFSRNDGIIKFFILSGSEICAESGASAEKDSWLILETVLDT
jgi:hypothetical protein